MRRLSPLCLPLACFVPAAVAAPCEPIEGLEPLLKPGRILMLGELHGTEESPAFILDVACNAAAKKLPVVVGLELRSDLQGSVDTFLASKGSDSDRFSTW